MNKFKILLLLFLIVLLIGLGTTYAFFNTNRNKSNEFFTSSYDVYIEEDDGENDWGEKNISLVNSEDAKSGAIIRLYYVEKWGEESISDVEIQQMLNYKNDNSIVFLSSLSNSYNNKNVVDIGWTNSFLNDFVDGGDGWYYYKKILQPGNSVKIVESLNLSNDISSNTELFNLYSANEYKFDVIFETCQATTKAVFDLWGKNIYIGNNNSINWNF